MHQNLRLKKGAAWPEGSSLILLSTAPSAGNMRVSCAITFRTCWLSHLNKHHHHIIITHCCLLFSYQQGHILLRQTRSLLPRTVRHCTPPEAKIMPLVVIVLNLVIGETRSAWLLFPLQSFSSVATPGIQSPLSSKHQEQNQSSLDRS